jgi:hypothetical protein
MFGLTVLSRESPLAVRRRGPAKATAAAAAAAAAATDNPR